MWSGKLQLIRGGLRQYSVAECMTEADGKKSFDYLKSAEIFANFAGQ